MPDAAARGDPDVDAHAPPRQKSIRRRRPPAGWLVLPVIAVGGALGALARYALDVAIGYEVGQFPWATFGTNVSGCLFIGGLMVLVTQVWSGRPLLRPFVGVGLLGGFTTFSTHVWEIQQAIDAGDTGIALAYLAGTLVAALTAVWVGVALTERAIRPRRRRRL